MHSDGGTKTQIGPKRQVKVKPENPIYKLWRCAEN